MSQSSKNKYRTNDKAFTRNRKLSFSQAVVFLLRKSMKSLQNSLNEFFREIDDNETTYTARAYSQMRKNFSHLCGGYRVTGSSTVTAKVVKEIL